MPTPYSLRRFPSAILLVVVAVAVPALAQTPAAPASTPAPSSDAAGPPPSAKTPVDTTSLASLAWLAGCWRGAVNQREFVEQWLPLRGGIMLGVSHNVMQDRTLDYEYLRLEPRADGIHYVAWPSGKPPTDFRLATATSDDNGTQFAFANVADAFPQRLVYRRGAEGWLYASIEGKVSGEVRSVTYPMRRVNCETGELITKSRAMNAEGPTPGAALAAFERMLAAGKDGALLRFSLGSEYLKAGDPARAAEHLARAVAQDADYTAAWKLLGKALAAAGRADDARAAYREGIEVARRKGDRQAEKEMTVFARRLSK